MTLDSPPMTQDEADWLADLQRCDGFNPCGECSKCTPKGIPWHEAYEKWRLGLQ